MSTTVVGAELAMRGQPAISRADVADFMLDEVHQNNWLNTTVDISD